MTILDKQTFRLKKKPLLVSMDDKAVLLDATQKVYYFLSEPAFSLLRALRKPRGASFGALKARFALEQKASGDKSASEVSGFLKQLADLDLLPAVDKGLLAKVKAKAAVAVIIHGGDLICWGTPIVPKPPTPPPPPPALMAYFVRSNLVGMVMPLTPAGPGGIPPTPQPGKTGGKARG
jgi:hypothetical protein